VDALIGGDDHAADAGLDGAAEVPINYMIDTSGNSPKDMSFCRKVPVVTAGAHTIKLRAKTEAGATFVIPGTTAADSDCRLQVNRFKSNGLGAGTIVTGDSLIANVSISSATYVDTGLDVTINTIANETVTLNFSGWAATQIGPGGTLRIAYQVDGGTDIFLTAHTVITGAVGTAKNMSTSTSFLIALPGSHTIKIRAKCSADTFTLVGAGSGDDISRMSVTQYRGGVIPIKNNAVDIVTTPSDLDFTSDFAVTNPSALKAQIDLNCLDLTTALKVQPLADGTYALGDTTKNFKALYLDQAGTDGGAVYFDAGTTEFLKSTADGTTLDIGGFTTVEPNADATTALGAAGKSFISLQLDNGGTDGGAIFFNIFTLSKSILSSLVKPLKPNG
jgi:hypothetical protein